MEIFFQLWDFLLENLTTFPRWVTEFSRSRGTCRIGSQLRRVSPVNWSIWGIRSSELRLSLWEWQIFLVVIETMQYARPIGAKNHGSELFHRWSNIQANMPLLVAYLFVLVVKISRFFRRKSWKETEMPLSICTIIHDLGIYWYLPVCQSPSPRIPLWWRNSLSFPTTLCRYHRCPTKGNTTFVRQQHLSEFGYRKFATFVRQRRLSNNDICPKQILLLI